ncbi:MAG: Ycf51 family protein [Microcystaceae cyanobacterium]
MFDNLLSSDLATYVKWSGILTILLLFLTILAFIVQWGIRFRLVGITSFMAVLTIGLFGLGLGFFERVVIPDAVRYALVYDNGANKAVITVPEDIKPHQLEATLEQAAYDLFSYGRTDLGGDHLMTIRARTLRHPQPGVTNPVYLGQVKRSLAVRDDDNLQIELLN